MQARPEEFPTPFWEYTIIFIKVWRRREKSSLPFCVRSLKGGRGDGSRNSSGKRGLQNLLRGKGNDLPPWPAGLAGWPDDPSLVASLGQPAWPAGPTTFPLVAALAGWPGWLGRRTPPYFRRTKVFSFFAEFARRLFCLAACMFATFRGGV